MTTLTGYVASPALYREVGIEAQPGDQVEIYLDQVKVPGFPEFIVGTIQNPVTVVCGGTSYPIEYDETDLAGSGVEFIEGDDILSIVVVSEARVLFAAEEAAREAADAVEVTNRNSAISAAITATLPVVRTRAEGYPSDLERRRVVAFSGAALPGDLAGLLVYLFSEGVYVNPVNHVEASISEYEVAAAYQRESNGLGGYRYKLTITRDYVTTGEWLSILDSLTAPLYAVGGSGADATGTPVVKTESVSVTELAPNHVGQTCIVDQEIFTATSAQGRWHKNITFTP